MSKAFFWVVAFLVAMATVNALGVSPGKFKLQYEAGVEKELTIRISNEGNAEKRVVIAFEGDLAQYFSAENGPITIKPGEQEVKLKLTMPKEIKTPGDNEAKIVIAEISGDGTQDKKIVMSAITTVISKVIIRVPYPDAYLEAKLYTSRAEVNQTVVFTIPVFNLGAQDITGTLTIRINDPTGKEVGVIKGDKFSLGAKKEVKYELKWIADVDPGEYEAELTVEYNGKEFKVDKAFSVGTMLVDIYKIEVLNFKLGDTAKFGIYLKNRWNKNLDNMFAEVQILDKNGRIAGQYTTPQFGLEPFKIKIIDSYWETRDATVGAYELKLFLHYMDKVFEDSFTIQVNEDSIETGMTGGVVASKGADSKIAIYVLIVLVLIVSNAILWMLYFKKLRKK